MAGIVALIIAVMQQAACAGNMTIVSRGIACTAGDSPSCLLTLGVDNTGTPLGLTGWQLQVAIVPSPDASGSVHFGSIVEPPNYVFDGITHEIVRSSESTLDFLLASDDIFFPVLMEETDPISIPPTGMNLLQVELNFIQAAGRFDIVVLADSGADSFWYSDTFDQMPLDVESPFGQAGVVESLAIVPEPSSLSMFLSAAGVIVFFRRQKRGGAYNRNN